MSLPSFLATFFAELWQIYHNRHWLCCGYYSRPVCRIADVLTLTHSALLAPHCAVSRHWLTPARRNITHNMSNTWAGAGGIKSKQNFSIIFFIKRHLKEINWFLHFLHLFLYIVIFSCFSDLPTVITFGRWIWLIARSGHEYIVMDRIKQVWNILNICDLKKKIWGLAIFIEKLMTGRDCCIFDTVDTLTHLRSIYHGCF